MTYTPKLPPYRHQVEAVDRAHSISGTGFAYLMEMGCVDPDTEYLSRSGWKRIADWDGGEVAQFYLSGEAEFVQPDAYIRKPADQLTRFTSPDKCDQVLSLHHRILYKKLFAKPHAWWVTTPDELEITPGYWPLVPAPCLGRYKLDPNKLPGQDGRFRVHSGCHQGHYYQLSEREPYTSPDGMMYCFSVPSGYLVLRRNGCIFATGNSGKSASLQLDWGLLYDAKEVNDLFIAAPAGVYRNWEKELSLHLDPAIYDAARIFTWRAGGGVQYKNDLARFLSRPDRASPRIFLCNTESFQVDTGLNDAAMEFLKGDSAMAAIDESTAIKNPAANRTKKIVNLKYKAPYRRILAGLPNPRSPLDFYSQFEFLDRRILGHSNFYTFRSEFCTIKRVVMRGAGGVTLLNKDGTPKKRPEIVGFRNLEKLKALVASASYRITKDECLDLPPKIYMPLREVKMHPEQRRIYNELRDNATVELGDGSHVTTQQVITQLLRLQQVLCGHVVDENNIPHDVPEHRTDALLEDLDAVGGKAIIWAPYRHSLAKIFTRVQREFGKNSIVAYHGGTSSDDRKIAIDRFQEDQETLFFLSNQQTGGRGITLTKAQAVIYYANSPDLELRLQSEDRPHRAGLRHPVAYSDLFVPNTIDERWIRTLRKKMDVSATVLGDGIRSWLV